MTCSILWMAFCELWSSWRPNGRKTYTSQWCLPDRSCPKIILKLLQQQVCFSLKHISFIISGSCAHLGGGTREWISSLSTRLRILPNTRSQFSSMRRMNTVPIIAFYLAVNTKAYDAILTSCLQWLHDLVHRLIIHLIFPATITNTWCLPMWPKQCPDDAIALHANCQLQGCICIDHLN